MKIENHETYKAAISADTFTFPHNPRVFDDSVEKFLDERDFAYAFTHYGLTNPIKSKRSIIISGHFDGATKLTDYQTLALHANDNQLKRLYFSSTKFFLGFFRNVKRTHTGGRTNFVDYVGSFVTPFGILFDDTQQSGVAAGAQSNDGNVATPIEQITGSVTAAQTVHIEDAAGNGFEFVASGTGTVTIYIVYLTDIGTNNQFTEYVYALIGTTRQKLVAANSDKSMILSLAAGESLNDIFAAGTITNITPTFKFRNGWSSD